MAELPTVPPLSPESVAAIQAECPSLRIMPQTPQLQCLMGMLRNKLTTADDFVFYSDRIIRLLIESALDEMPHVPLKIETPTGCMADSYGWGLPYKEKICGVSIVRAGESMEAGLRQVCRGIKIGKILIQRDEETALPKLYYSKFPPNIKDLTVLLLDPMLATGGSAIAAIKVLNDAGVANKDIVFINLVCCPEGVRAMHEACPDVRIVTACIDSHLNEKKYIMPGLGDFGDRYFDTI